MSADWSFAKLSPDTVVDAVESLGLLSDLRVMALNSYENRVYQIGIEDGEPLIAKFYRPQRWSNAQIEEEHRFSQQLVDADIPVIAPLEIQGRTLHSYADFRFSLYTRRGGHAPELDDMDQLYQLGEMFGRIHAVAKAENFQHRPSLDLQSFGHDSVDFLLGNCVPDDLRAAYEPLAQQLLDKLEQELGAIDYQAIRCHGDAHVGNILQRDERIHFVDLDDARMAPAMQDLWMFVTGDQNQRRKALSELIEGYESFCDFERREFALIEPLRTLRLLHHAAWIGRRWQDPAFPMAFPWFNTPRFWSEHIVALREQVLALDEAPLQLL